MLKVVIMKSTFYILEPEAVIQGHGFINSFKINFLLSKYWVWLYYIILFTKSKIKCKE